MHDLGARKARNPKGTMAAIRSLMMFILFSSIILHISLLFGVISVGSESHSTAVSVVEGETGDEDDDDDGNGVVEIEDAGDLEVFEPTKEWQTIKEGQAIPAGLHVRINLSSGEKEAKLLDGQDTAGAMEEGGQSDASPTGGDEERHTKEDLERRLAKMEEEEEGDCQEPGCGKTDQELIEEVKQRYRSLDELKKEFSELELNVETDYEIMTRLIQEYRDNPSTEHRIRILQDLEFYVHQVDNAVDLQSLGGWGLVIGALNSSEEEIQAEAAHVLGSAVQSNSKAQVTAFDGGAMNPLLRLLAQSPSPAVQKSALYALSSLVRFFPYAQLKFLELGGLSVLTGIMQASEGSRLPVMIKSMTLLHDLLVEQKNVLSANDEVNEQSEERRSQYEMITLASKMVEQGWCDFVPSMLDVSDHDTREKAFHSLKMLLLHCNYNADSELRNSLESLRTEYQMLSEEELAIGDDDDYFTGLLGLVEQIIQDIS